VDGTGHVKLTDFGLATGALNPKRIESLKVKVSLCLIKRTLWGDILLLSWTKSKTIKLFTVQQSNVDLSTGLSVMKIHAMQTP